MWVVAPRTSLFCVAAERPPDALADWLLLLQNDTPNEARFGLVDNSVSSTLEGATLDDMKRSVTARSVQKNACWVPALADASQGHHDHE